MALLTRFASFFVSPFGEDSICDELNHFLKSHRIVNLEKKVQGGCFWYTVKRDNSNV